MAENARSALVFGARNLGKAIIESLRGAGWNVAGVARSDQTLEGVAALGALAIRADVTDPDDVTRALAGDRGRAWPARSRRQRRGGLRRYAVGAVRRRAARRGSARRVRRLGRRTAARGVLVPLGHEPLPLAQDRPATIVQVTGGSARRAMPGRGLWAAGAFGVRALTHAAALELREHGIQVTLLIVDAGIEPLTGKREGVDPAALADPYEIARAVRFLGEQGPGPRRTSCR